MASTDPPVQKTRSLFYSLLLSMLVLMLCVVGFISINGYLYTKNNFERESNLLRLQTEQNIIEALRLEEITLDTYDETLNGQMRNGLVSVLLEYNRSGGDPARMNLERIQQVIGDNFDIYVINESGVIVSTTYQPELGLDFRKVPYFYDYLTKIRQSDGFYPDRIVRDNLGAGRLHKFAYMPTADHRYILELGFSSSALDALNEQLDDRGNIQRIISVNPYVKEFTIFNSMGRQIGNNSFPEKNVQAFVNGVLKNRTSLEVPEPDQQQITSYLLIDLKVDKYGSDPSRVVAITYDLRLIQDNLNRLVLFHIAIGVVTIFIGLALAYVFSRDFIRPIRKIAADADLIAHGDLEHRIGRTRSSEFAILENSINLMVDSLKHALMRVKDEEILRKEIDDQLPVAIFMKNISDGRYVFWNKASERIFGFDAAAVIGKSDRELFSQDLVSEIELEDTDAIRNQISVSNKKIQNKVLGQRIIHFIIVPVYNSGQSLQYILGIGEDITEETRSLKMDLLTSITRRDILDQLSTIMNYLERAQLKATLTETRIFFDKTIGSIESIRKQMAFGKSLQDLGILSPKWQSVHRAWDDAVSLLPDHTIEIINESPDFEIFSDPLLPRVFYNLLINSLNHGGAGLARVRFYAETSGDSLTLVFEDDGIGIPSDQKDQIFEFGRGDGAGLGLFLVREILGNTGIRISETGEPGTGARFEMVIPRGKFRDKK